MFLVIWSGGLLCSRGQQCRVTHITQKNESRAKSVAMHMHHLCAKLSQVSCLFFKTSHYKGKTSYLADQFLEIQTWVLKYKRGSSLETAQILAFVFRYEKSNFSKGEKLPTMCCAFRDNTAFSKENRTPKRESWSYNLLLLRILIFRFHTTTSCTLKLI